jgi:glycosyltransferase involved in cell wall biosynthesis
MKHPRLYLFDPNLKGSGGHYLGYATRVAQASEAAGIPASVVANLLAEPQLAPCRILPRLERDYWQEMCPSAGKDPHDHLSQSAQLLADTLDRTQSEEAISESDILFFPYVNLAEVMGLARWRGKNGAAARIVLLFRRDLDEQGLDAAVGARCGAALLRQAISDLLVCPGSDRVRFFTDSNELTEEYSQSLRRRFQTAPIPVHPALFAPRTNHFGKNRTLLYLGDARKEKGYDLLPQIVRALKTELAEGHIQMIAQSNFNIAGGEPGIRQARDFLSTLPNITLLRKPITDEQYNEYLLSAGIMLLPYQPERYVSRTSGILAEAICAGVPAVVPQGTWLADQVRRHGAGTVYDSSDPEGVVRAVKEALVSLNVLQRRAGERRGSYARFHRPSRLVEFVCGAQALALARERCLA